jgi:hypothetical protein
MPSRFGQQSVRWDGQVDDAAFDSVQLIRCDVDVAAEQALPVDLDVADPEQVSGPPRGTLPTSAGV